MNSDGFTTTVLPAASAAESLNDNNRMGEFQGVIIAHTPSGSWRVYAKVLGLSIGSVLPSTLSARPP